MATSTSPAMEALNLTEESRLTPDQHADPNIINLVKEFTTALKQKHPDDVKFNVNTLYKWCMEYCRLTQQTAPEPFSSTYALGKYLVKHQKALGIQEIGSYGNRRIYTPDDLAIDYES